MEQRASRIARSGPQDRILAIVDEHYAGSNAVIHFYIHELLKQLPTLSRLDVVFRGNHGGLRFARAGTRIKIHKLRGRLCPWDAAPSLAERLLPCRLRSIYRRRFAERHRWLASLAPVDTKLLRLLFDAERMRAIVCFTHSLRLARQIARLVHIFCESHVPHLVCVTPQRRADARVIADLEWLKVTLLQDGEVEPVSDADPGPQSQMREIDFAQPQPLSFFDPASDRCRQGFCHSRVDWPSWVGPARPRSARVRDVVLFIRPDWMRCGSGTTFENLAAYFRSRDALLIDIAIWPYDVPYAPSDRSQKLDEEERFIGGALYFGLRRTSSPLRKMRQLPKLLRSPPMTVVSQALCAYQFVARPRMLVAAVRRARIDIVYLNHYFTYAFARDLIGERAFLLDTHDIQSVNYLQEGYRNGLTGRTDTLAAMLCDELQVLRRAKRLSFVSLTEMQVVHERLEEASAFHFVALPRIDPLPSKTRPTLERPRLLIVASENRANARSLEWFLHRVWPQATRFWHERAHSPKLLLDVVGSVASPFAGRWYDGVTFHGVVDLLDEHYRACDLVVLPVISGSGIAIKTVEALLYGRPVVGTAHAFRGLPRRVVELIGHVPAAENGAEEIVLHGCPVAGTADAVRDLPPEVRTLLGHVPSARSMAEEIVDLLSCAPKLAERARVARLAGDALRNQPYCERLDAALEAVRDPKPD